MSLLTKASLILTPTAYKASKLYSIVPTNGNGDMTVVRNTTATRENGSGIIESVGNNIPRLNYDSNSSASILLEPQRSNLALNSENFGAAYWTKRGLATVTDDASISPDGTLDADTLINASGALVWNIGNQLERDVPSILALTTYTFSIYVKSLGSTTFGIALRNQVNGNTISANIIPTSEWQRITVSQTTTVNISIGILIGNTNGNVAIWGAQLEQGAYPTSYIPTTTTALARNADVLSRNNIYLNYLIEAGKGTWFINLENNIPLLRDTFSYGLYLNQLANGAGNGFSIRNSNPTAVSRLSLGTVAAGAITDRYLTLTDKIKVAIRWNGVTADFFVNGAKVISNIPFTTTLINFFNSSPADVPRYIKSMMLFPTPLTDDECTELTS